MFEQFVKRPFHLALYRNCPYSVERGLSLAHFLEITSGLPTIQPIARWITVQPGIPMYSRMSDERTPDARCRKAVIGACYLWRPARRR